MSDCCATESTPDESPDQGSSCCAIPEGTAFPCPQCGTEGPVVGERPVQPHRPEAVEGGWQFCAEESCPVVYYLEELVLSQGEVRTQVGNKATNMPLPVCFCFSHTSNELVTDREAHDGQSTIKAAIKKAVSEGFCACEHLNPSGQCCLPDVHRALKGHEPAGGTGPEG
jgi:hypothetical protein